MDKTIYKFFVLMNEQGVAVSDMNNDIKALIDSGVLTYSQALPFLTNLRLVGTNQQALIKWAEPTDVAPPEDAPAYSGPVNAAGLTLGNKAYIANHNGSFSSKWGQVFNGPISYPSDNGVLANTPEDPKTPDGFDLSSF
jgi:hypothetical protein